MTKEKVFFIMGKYYGNAHFRWAIESNISEEDLCTIVRALDEVNSLGYYFSNFHRLYDIEDIRIVPIILKYYNRFADEGCKLELLGAINKRKYRSYARELLNIYKNTSDNLVKNEVSQCLLHIRSKKEIEDYLEIVNDIDYGKQHDYIMDLLCKLHEKRVLPKLLSLVREKESVWKWTFLEYAAGFKENSLIPILEQYLDNEDSECRAMARKALKKMEKNQECKA